MRTTGVGQPWTTLTPAPITALSYVDQNAVDYRVTYIYRLQANYSSTPPGTADLTVALPKPADPTNFVARASGGTVNLSWTAATSAAATMVYGPGLPTAGMRVSGASYAATGVAGPNIYRVASLYEPGGVLTPSTAWPSAMAVVVPQPSVPWLTMTNGGGDPLTTDAYYYKNFQFSSSKINCKTQACPLVYLLHDFGVAIPGWAEDPANPVPQVDLLFADPLGLGFGRRVHCAQKGSGGKLATLCWAETFGAAPGSPTFDDPGQALYSAQTFQSHRGTTAILHDRSGIRFFSFKHITDSWGEDPLSGVMTAVDTYGARQVPHGCLPCHGGKYNAGTLTVDGGAFIPIDPKGLLFPTAGGTRAEQEDKIRAVNSMIAGSGASATVSAYVNGMYNGAVAQAGTRANDAYIPPGWSAQAGMYRDIIHPYCMSCHMTQTGYLAFATWNDFLASKDRIQNALCNTRSMPHSQVQYQKLWTSGGNVFLPGVISASLGYAKCP
jgi:hypothetical protein